MAPPVGGPQGWTHVLPARSLHRRIRPAAWPDRGHGQYRRLHQSRNADLQSLDRYDARRIALLLQLGDEAGEQGGARHQRGDEDVLLVRVGPGSP